MRAAIAVVAVIMIAIGIARAADDGPTTEPAGTATVTGKVVTDANQPAVDCIVTLAQNAEKMRTPLQTATDRDGKFKFEKVPEGTWNLNVRTRDLKSKAIKSLSTIEGRTVDVGTLKLQRPRAN